MTNEAKRGPGRPAILKQGSHTRALRLSDELLNRVHAIAHAEERSVTAQVRYILERYCHDWEVGRRA